MSGLEASHQIILKQLVETVFPRKPMSYRCYLLFPSGPGMLRMRYCIGLDKEEKAILQSISFCIGQGCQGTALAEKKSSWMTIPLESSPEELANMRSLPINYARMLVKARVRSAAAYPFLDKSMSIAFVLAFESSLDVEEAGFDDKTLEEAVVNQGIVMAEFMPDVKDKVLRFNDEETVDFWKGPYV